MSLNVNEVGNVVIKATKNGQPATYEKIISVTLSKPEAGTPVISEDAMTATINWSATATADFTVEVDIDNVAGDGGSLKLLSAPISTIDGVLADGGTVEVS